MKVILVSFAFLAGCSAPADPAWNSAPETHYCNAEQMTKVQNETAFCSSATNYSKNYCYDAAIMRNCDSRDRRIKGDPLPYAH